MAAWVKPEEDMPSALFIVAASTSASTADFARLGELKEFALPVALAVGESVDLRIRTRHRAANVLPDTRDLSFLLVRLSAH
ncbi:hypothetical protein ACO2Q1_07340 [Brevundimonas sp. VNH65]|uniref:hypothetical protein n=1 Tax=Brevundimonas sp. VNH65 TaxID=3400917 RepID=UPI003C03367F